MNRHVFRSIIENMKWNYRVNGFAGTAASLSYDIIMDHPLVDGNKRLASLMLYYFIKKNDYILKKRISSMT